MKRRSSARLAAILSFATALAWGTLGSSPSVAAPSPRLTDAAAGGTLVGRADPALGLRLGVFLKGPHDDEIQALQMAQANPRSPLYRHFLSAKQYGGYFGATPDQVARTIAYLRAHGFAASFVGANNRYILANGSAAAAEATFGTPIDMRVTSEGRHYYANRFEATLPRELPWVQAIAGMDSYHLVHSHAIVADAHRGLTPEPQATVLPGKFAFGPQDLYTAYDFNTSYTGTGKTIAIPVVRNFLPSDVFTYSSQFGISNPSYNRVFLSGTCASPCPVPTSAADAGETALDTELSHAAAPSAALDVISQNDGLFGSQELSFQYIANVLGPAVQTVSSSYGACESRTDPTARDGIAAAIDQGVLEGQTWFAASGDDGADDCKTGLKDIDFPSGVPAIVAVGGTTLNTSIFMGNVQSYTSEYAWNDSGCGNVGGATGGGVSRFYGKPAWQTNKTYNDKVRDVPDVAAEADPFQQTQYPATCPAGGGYWVLVEGNWQQIGGTSGASPFWAGIMADVSQALQAPLGLVNPELYALKGDGTKPYHTITIGDNTFKGVAGYQAAAGYSRVTGLGSPDEAHFIASFAKMAPPTPRPTAFPSLQPHPMKTPAAQPTARAFIPIAVSATNNQDIAVFDASTGASKGTQLQLITGTASSPVGITASPTGGAIYVLEFGSTIDKITTTSAPYTFQQGVYLPPVGRANAIAAQGSSLYVSDGFNDQIDQINIKTGATVAVKVGHGPTGLAPAPKATALYYTNTGDGTLGVINTTTGAVVQTVKVGAAPIRVAVNHSGKMAYVVDSGDGTITPVKFGKTKAIPGKPVYVGGEPTSIAINSNDTLAFVTNLFCPQPSGTCSPTGQNALGVVEVLTLKTKPIGVECCIVVGQNPGGAAFEPTGHYLWVINGGNSSASIIDSFTNTVVATATTTTVTSVWESTNGFVATTPK